jgi:adenylosuccinate synthase
VRAWVVIDLGFGDAGKGLVTDALVRATGAPIVARFNGGAQAAHNVVTADGRHHTFAQLGAGTFAGAATVLGPRVVVHPTALLAEARAFGDPGVLARVSIDARAPLVTPFHQALGRLRELARGDARHGSCGVGVGEAVRDGLATMDDAIVAGDLNDPERLRAKLAAAGARLAREAAALAAACDPDTAAREHTVFTDDALAARWMDAAAPVAACVHPPIVITEMLASAPELVLEGAQGVLLDEDHGFHPYTTWSRCTDAYAQELLHDVGAAIVRVGVSRAWAVRHGPGPLPSEAAALAGVMADHNRANPWQGAVRNGHFDAVLLRYALDVLGGVDRLVLTHLDTLTRAAWTPAEAWDLDGARITRLPLPARGLAAQEALGARVARARPILGPATRDPAAVLRRVTDLLDHPVGAASSGPTARDLRFGPRFFERAPG